MSAQSTIATDTCLNCGEPVQVSIFKGSHYCSANCLDELTDGTGDQELVNEMHAERLRREQAEAAKAEKAAKRKAAEKERKRRALVAEREAAKQKLGKKK